MADPVWPTLSVIVVTYNERELVERSLPPLVEQLGEGDELIVADNRSSDGSADAVRRLAPSASCSRSGGRQRSTSSRSL